MPKVIDIRDNDNTELQEIVVSDELRLIGFHQNQYRAFELLHEDGEEISVPFSDIDDLIKALQLVKQVREEIQG